VLHSLTFDTFYVLFVCLHDLLLTCYMEMSEQSLGYSILVMVWVVFFGFYIYQVSVRVNADS
jgi:hypothetical protein